jgi:hypothetical protein
MAQRTEVRFVDDLDGSEADETVHFAVDGVQYEIDLSAAHAEELRAALKPFTDAARRVGRSTRSAGRSPRPSGPSPSAVREWARVEGIKVSDRGRVPAELVVKFQAASTH